MIKNLLYDFGGVIVDADLEAACNVFRSIGLTNIEDYLNLYRQNGIFLDVEEGRLDRAGFCDAFRKLVGRDVSDEDIDSGWLAIVKSVNVEKLRWIESHRKDYRFYVLSNINPFVFDYAYTDRFSSLGKPLPYYFDQIFASYRLGVTKPSADIFEIVIRETGLKPEETLFIDDGARNIEMGKQLGFITYQPKNGENWIPAVERIIEEQKVK